MKYSYYNTELWDGVEATVWFEYEPPQEERSHGPTEARQPGFPSEVRIGEILIGEVEISDDLHPKFISNLEGEILEWVER